LKENALGVCRNKSTGENLRDDQIRSDSISARTMRPDSTEGKWQTVHARGNPEVSMKSDLPARSKASSGTYVTSPSSILGANVA